MAATLAPGKSMPVDMWRQAGLRTCPAVKDLPLAKLPTKHGMVEIPRWVVLGQFDSLAEVSAAEVAWLNRAGVPGTREEIEALPAGEKLSHLARLTSEPIAASGVAFVGEYHRFYSDAIMPRRARWTAPLRQALHNRVAVTFDLTGIVQKCGTRELVQRLLSLTTLPPSNPEVGEVSSDFPKSEELTHQPVEIQGIAIGELAILLGLLMPTAEGPAVYSVSDLGWPLAPHNVVVGRGRRGTELPHGFHLYTINIEGLEEVRIFTEMPEQLQHEFRSLQFEAQKFAAKL